MGKTNGLVHDELWVAVPSRWRKGDWDIITRRGKDVGVMFLKVVAQRIVARHNETLAEGARK